MMNFRLDGSVRTHSLWVMAMLLCSIVCSPPQAAAQESRTPYDISDPRNATAIVATVGDITITAQQFLLSYEFGPAFVKREKESRKRYLDFMINEKLLALDAYERGTASSPMAARTLDEFEGDLATEELYKDDVLSKVHVSEAQVEQGVREELFHLKLQWIYAKRLDTAEHIDTLLSSGASFDSLFREQEKDSVLLGNRSMETTRFQLRMSNPTLSAAVDTLSTGVPSHPIKAPDGWYIVSVADAWRDALPNESTIEKYRYDVRRALTQQKSDSLSDRYVRRMLLRNNPVIIRTTFDLLRAYLGSLMVTEKQFADWGLAAPLGKRHPPPDWSKIDQYGTDTLVTLRKGTVTLAEFLLWYRARETVIHLKNGSQQEFFLSMEDLIWRMVRDRLLVNRARSRRLQERVNVKTQLKWWEEKVMYEMEKKYLAGTIPLSDSIFTAYYKDHLRDYRDTAGNPKQYETVRDEVRKAYFVSALNARIFHRLVALKRKYHVEIRENTLEKLPIDTEAEPRAIDIYTVKTGGTFPRPAFPAIDYAWQAWN